MRVIKYEYDHKNANSVYNDSGCFVATFVDDADIHRFAASQDMQDTIASALADLKVIMPDQVRAQFEYVLNLSKGVK